MAPVTAAAAVLLLCCGSALGLRRQQRFKPDFVACDSPRPCGTGGLPGQYLLDLLKNVNSSAVRKLEAGRTPTLLHIGAANLGNEANFADRDLYTKLASTLSQAVSASLKLILVEPNDFFLPDLSRNVRTLPLASGNVQIVRGMVAGSCDGNYSSMYRFSYQVSQDFGANFGIYGSWFSTQYWYPLQALGGFCGSAQNVPKKECEGLRRLAAMPNVTSYLKEVKVPCFTPASLLAATHSLASDLAMVVTDAESKDLEIVHKMLELPGFSPGYLQWEGNFPHMAGLGLELQRMNYSIGATTDGGGDHDAGNIVAVAME